LRLYAVKPFAFELEHVSLSGLLELILEARRLLFLLFKPVVEDLGGREDRR